MPSKKSGRRFQSMGRPEEGEKTGKIRRALLRG